MRLIDAGKIIWEINEIHKNHGLKDHEQIIFDETDVIGLIVTAPTIDAVPVVRCKDCVHFHMLYNSESDGMCSINTEGLIYMKSNDFCSYGGREFNVDL